MPQAKYKRGKDGLFRTAIRTGTYDENGRPISIRLSSNKSSADLERKVREKRYELEHSTPTQKAYLNFRQYAQSWLDTEKSNISVRTRQMYQNIIDKYLYDIAEIDITAVTPEHITTLMRTLAKTHRIAQQAYCTINQVCQSAVRKGLLATNPCSAVILPHKADKTTQRNRILAQSEKELIRAVNCDCFHKAFLLTLYGTGMRPSEVIALEWSDIDFSEHTISVTKAVKYLDKKPVAVGLPKTEKSIRTIPAPSFVFGALQELSEGKGTNTHPYIFCGKDGQIMTYEAYKNAFYFSLAKALGYTSALKCKNETHITLYSMRHNFCTECRAANISIESCQALMGHSSAKMVLEVYSHYSAIEEVKGKLDKLNL